MLILEKECSGNCFSGKWVSGKCFSARCKDNVQTVLYLQTVFKGIFRPKTGDLQNKKNKKQKRSSLKLRLIFRPKSEIQRFFPLKNRWSPKKKKNFTKIETDFSAEIRNSKVFSTQKQVVSKKKRSSLKLRLIFWPKSEIQKFFPPKNRWSQKKKKKVFTEIEAGYSPNFENSNVWGGAVFLWGGYFQFFTKNRPQKRQKSTILYTSQANGEARAPSPAPPPGYATDWLLFLVHSL